MTGNSRPQSPLMMIVTSGIRYNQSCGSSLVFQAWRNHTLNTVWHTDLERLQTLKTKVVSIAVHFRRQNNAGVQLSWRRFEVHKISDKLTHFAYEVRFHCKNRTLSKHFAGANTRRYWKKALTMGSDWSSGQNALCTVTRVKPHPKLRFLYPQLQKIRTFQQKEFSSNDAQCVTCRRQRATRTTSCFTRVDSASVSVLIWYEGNISLLRKYHFVQSSLMAIIDRNRLCSSIAEFVVGTAEAMRENHSDYLHAKW